jgi:hypothetical protein
VVDHFVECFFDVIKFLPLNTEVGEGGRGGQEVDVTGMKELDEG